MTETLYEGKYLKLLRRGRWEYAERRNASGIVVIVAETPDDEVLFVEQLRPPMNSRVLELPAGLSGDIVGQEDEALTTAAERELVEETGYEAHQMKRLGDAPPTSGMCSELHTYFHATQLVRVSDGGGDESEDIEVHVVPRGQIRAFLAGRMADGCLVASSVYAGLWLADIR